LNIVAGREVVPELLQERCTGAELAAAAERLLADPDAWRAQVRELDAIASALGAGGAAPSERAAAAVAALFDTRT
jgi:lipid-A-disaccharide synthase